MVFHVKSQYYSKLFFLNIQDIDEIFKNWRIADAYETSCRLDTSIFETNIRISNDENGDIQI